MNKPLATQIDALLPQTQCGKCGYPGCMPYALAISQAEADINRCPPGGESGIIKLAELLNVAPKPLDPAYGVETPRRLAVIREADCIGCTKCLPACPVDAIIGAAKQMHTVIEQYCTGCDLCLVACPVDCIVMEITTSAWSQEDANTAKARYLARNQRIEKLATEKAERLKQQKQQLALLKTSHSKL